MAISPAHDPSSYMFNETLNDYMANLAGLIPSIDTYEKHRKVSAAATKKFFEMGNLTDSALTGLLEKAEDWANPFN